VTSFIRRFLAAAALAALRSPARRRPPSGASSSPIRRRRSLATARPAGPLIGYLTAPSGAGPFPAVALIPSCLGLPENRAAFAATLAGWGYVALYVDEFAPRGSRDLFGRFSRRPGRRGGGAGISRASAVRRRQRVVAVVGFSQGGDVALAVAASPPRGARLRAAAAITRPAPTVRARRSTVPTLILVGAADSVTPAADCRHSSLRSRQAREARRSARRRPSCSTIPLPPAAGSSWACISPTTAPRRRAPSRNCADFWRRDCRRGRDGD
jgi:dienelactone hydrolase